jgi:hypothetical protein
MARGLVPDLDPEFVHAAAAGCLVVNNGQDEVIAGITVDLARALELASGPRDGQVRIVQGVESKLPNAN